MHTTLSITLQCTILQDACISALLHVQYFCYNSRSTSLNHCRESTSPDQDLEHPYDYIEPIQTTVDGHVAMETNPAYLSGIHVDSNTADYSSDLSYI